MKIFFGAAIQGAPERGTRSHINGLIMDALTGQGHTLLAEHTRAQNSEETTVLLEKIMGPLPLDMLERRRFVRQKLIGFVEKPDLDAAVFELSIPSHGTAVEVTHAYLRPRLGLPTIPILCLYERGYWPNGLSTMISGLPPEEMPNVQIEEYTSKDELTAVLARFATGLSTT